MRLHPVEAAKHFIDQVFPQCSVAFLAGSASRGEHKDNSDLDIVIIDDTLQSAYRESLFDLGWRMEIFVHTRASIVVFQERRTERTSDFTSYVCTQRAA